MRTAYLGGRVYTGELPLKEAFLVEEGRFVHVGTNREVEALLQSGDQKIDLSGRFVSAGFNDSHMHLLNFGQSLYGARLAEHTSSLAELLTHLKDCLRKDPPEAGGWLIGRGWNQDYFTDAERMPDRHDLDTVSTEVPILITRACGHSCVVNSCVLKLAGISAGTPDPEGGSIGREASGEPDGRLYEKAIGLLDSVKPQPGKKEIREMLLLAMREVNRYGITSVQTDDYSAFRTLPFETVNEAYRELEAEGKMTLRVTEQANFTDLSALSAFIEKEKKESGSTFFRIGPVKLLGDGSLGSRTAHLSRPYLGSDGEMGFSLFPPEELKALVSLAHENGMPVAVHAIGDACLDEVLDAIEEALEKEPREDHRHGIVHCQISRKDQLERIARLKLHVYAQSIFLDYDNHIVERLVPPELARTSYSWKSLKDAGVTVSNGSDCPVELPDVLAGIQCAVTRRSLDGTGPFLSAEAFSVAEALDSFTLSGARASFEEKIKGRIREGMLADFVVLDRDPFETAPEELHSLKVLKTVLGGETVFAEETE